LTTVSKQARHCDVALCDRTLKLVAFVTGHADIFTVCMIYACTLALTNSTWSKQHCSK